MHQSHAGPPDASHRPTDRLGTALAALLPDEREIELTLPSTEYIDSALGALAWGPAIWFGLSMWLRRVYHGAESQYFGQSFVYAGLLVAALAAVSVLVKRARQGPVRVVADAEGIRETEGGRTRVAVRWRDARSFVAARDVRDTRSGAVFGQVDLRLLALDGGVIRSIDWEPWHLFGRGTAFRVYVRRSLAPLQRVVAALPPLEQAPEDPRIARRRGGVLTDLAVWIGGLGMWAGPFVCAWWIRHRTWPSTVGGDGVIDALDVALASVGLFVVSLRRMTRVLGEAVRTRRARAAAPATAPARRSRREARVRS